MKYYRANNYGKGFITHEDNERSHISYLCDDIYSTENNPQWATRVSSVEITEEEALRCTLSATGSATPSTSGSL